MNNDVRDQLGDKQRGRIRGTIAAVPRMKPRADGLPGAPTDPELP